MFVQVFYFIQVSINCVTGAVSFIPRGGDKSNLQIFVFGQDHLINHPTGIRCSIDSTGRMVIASNHVDGLQVRVVGLLPIF